MSPFEGPLRLEDMRQPARVIARGHFAVHVVGLPFGGSSRTVELHQPRPNCCPLREISTRIVPPASKAMPSCLRLVTNDSLMLYRHSALRRALSRVAVRLRLPLVLPRVTWYTKDTTLQCSYSVTVWNYSLVLPWVYVFYCLTWLFVFYLVVLLLVDRWWQPPAQFMKMPRHSLRSGASEFPSWNVS